MYRSLQCVRSALSASTKSFGSHPLSVAPCASPPRYASSPLSPLARLSSSSSAFSFTSASRSFTSSIDFASSSTCVASPFSLSSYTSRRAYSTSDSNSSKSTSTDVDLLSATIEEVVADAESSPGMFDALLGPLAEGFIRGHELLGTPWWGTVVLTVFTLRVLCAPLTIKSIKAGQSMVKMQPLMTKIKDKYKTRRSPEDMRAMQAEVGALYASHSTNPFKGMFYGLAQTPIWLSFFFMLRRIAANPPPGLDEGGLWWFTNLAEPDPYYLLPITSAVTMVATIWLNKTGAPASKQANHMKMAFSAFCFLMPYLTRDFPAVLHVYWTASTFGSLAFQTSMVRKLCGIEAIVPPAQAKLDQLNAARNVEVPAEIFTSKDRKTKLKIQPKKRPPQQRKTLGQKTQSLLSPLTEQIQKDFTPAAEREQLANLSHQPKIPYRFGTFQEDRSVADFMLCELEEGHIASHSVSLEEVVSEYNRWCVERGMPPKSAHDLLSSFLEKRYHPIVRDNVLVGYRGIRLVRHPGEHSQ